MAVRASRSPDVTGFGTNGVCNFLLINSSNFGLVLHGAPFRRWATYGDLGYRPKAGMLSPRTGLGLEAKKLALASLGLGLDTLRPRPRVVWPRGLVFITMYLFPVLSQLLL